MESTERTRETSARRAKAAPCPKAANTGLGASQRQAGRCRLSRVIRQLAPKSQLRGFLWARHGQGRASGEGERVARRGGRRLLVEASALASASYQASKEAPPTAGAQRLAATHTPPPGPIVHVDAITGGARMRTHWTLPRTAAASHGRRTAHWPQARDAPRAVKSYAGSAPRKPPPCPSCPSCSSGEAPQNITVLGVARRTVAGHEA